MFSCVFRVSGSFIFSKSISSSESNHYRAIRLFNIPGRRHTCACEFQDFQSSSTCRCASITTLTFSDITLFVIKCTCVMKMTVVMNCLSYFKNLSFFIKWWNGQFMWKPTSLFSNACCLLDLAFCILYEKEYAVAI